LDVQAGKTNQQGAVAFSCPAAIPKSCCFDLRSLTLIYDGCQTTCRADGCRDDHGIRSKSDQNRCVMQRNLLRIRLDLWLTEGEKRCPTPRVTTPNRYKKPIS
jgi:hypothetical protein